MASTLSQKWFKKPMSKSSKFRVVWTNFASMWYRHFVKEYMEDFRITMSVLVTVAGKIFDGKFPTKIDFPIGYFMLPFLMLTLEV